MNNKRDAKTKSSADKKHGLAGSIPRDTLPPLTHKGFERSLSGHTEFESSNHVVDTRFLQNVI